MSDDDDPKASHPEAETRPGGPRALRLSTSPPKPREAWAFETEPGTGRVAAVKVLCQGCHREIRLAPPRFAVDDFGEVTASDQGAAFRCTICDVPVGPLILADWRFGRM